MSFLQSPYMACPECGASLLRAEADAHECDPERRLDYQVSLLRRELTDVDDDLADYLATARGRFDAWYAERERKGAASP